VGEDGGDYFKFYWGAVGRVHQKSLVVVVMVVRYGMDDMGGGFECRRLMLRTLDLW
jgi:hypothetical protein